MEEAGLYVKANGLQKNDAEYVLDNYGRLVKWKSDGTDSILDVGCGTGDVTMEILHPILPKNFGRLLGADLSENMINFAKKKFCKPNIDFIQLDIASNSYPVDYESSFDHIFSFYCLHWVQNQKTALENMYAMLAKGGDMLLTFLANHPLFKIYETLHKSNKWSKYMKNLDDYVSPYQNSENPEKEFGCLLRNVGFKVHLCKVVERKYIYPNLEILKKSIMAVNPFMKSIPENLRMDYIEEYIDQIRAMNIIERNHNNNEEKIHCPYNLFVVFCTKS